MVGCIGIQLTGTGVVGEADFGSFDADGFTIIMDNQFEIALRISYLALGGDDLTNVYIGDLTTPTSAGNFSETGVGFQPDAIIFSSAGINGTSGTGTTFGHSVGVATGSANQGTIMGFSRNGVTTTTTSGYGYNAELVAPRMNNSGDTLHRDAFVSMNADGFTLNHLEGSSAVVLFYIALKGGQYKVGELTTRTDGNDIVETEPGFSPAAILFLSANRALSTQDSPTTNNNSSIGAATSTTNRTTQAV